MNTTIDAFGQEHVPTAGSDLPGREFRHDLRQPLAMVGLLVDALLSRTDLAPDVLALLERVRDQSDWMAELLRSTEHDESVTVVDLAEAVHGPCSAVPDGAPYDVCFLPEDDAEVLVDPVGLRRAAWNLMDNARRAVAHGGRVEARVTRHHRDAVLEVADSGPGFGRIPAQQGHGLVGVGRFATRFGGELAVGRSSLGGALVCLRLPLALSGAHSRGC